MNANHINGTLSPETGQAILNGIEQVHALMPFLINLSPDERQAMPKVGEKSRAFVSTAVTLAGQHEEILPRGFNLEDFRANTAMMEALYPIRLALEHLLGLVEDSYYAARSDAYTASLQVYAFAKSAHLSAGGMNSALEDMGRRFAKKSRSANKPVNGEDKAA